MARMSRQMLSARLSSFKSLYRSTLANASGMLCSEIDFSSKCITAPTRLLLRIAEHPEQFRHRIEEAIDYPLLERDDRIVGDGDVFRANLGTALGDVAEADAEISSQICNAIACVQRMHFKRG